MMKWSTMTQDWSMKLKVCVWFFCFIILNRSCPILTARELMCSSCILLSQHK